jgi:transglycosylase-like protein with SLT domain
MTRPPIPSTIPPLCAILAALVLPGGALADATETSSANEAPAPATATTTVPAPAPPSEATSPGAPAASPPASTTPTGTSTSQTTTTTATPEVTTVPAPTVRAQRSQPPTAVKHAHGPALGGAPGQEGSVPGAAKSEVSPSSLTPPLPSALGGSLLGVPSFFIDSFSIPPFLLPIYQAAGAAYGIPWQVLAAINEVETDYGRDLNVSSAGAEGWMQFLPSTWGQYGVDVNNDGFQDPYNPADAIFAAARYLKAAGGDTDIKRAVFAYNHSPAYVNSVLLRARLLGGTPPELLGAITGLTEARFPVFAAAHYSDGFPTTEGPSPHAVAGTTIYSQDGAPAIAVQDGRIAEISRQGPLGPSITLVDAYGNAYTYAGLGTLARLYPVLEAREPAGPGAGGPPLARAGSLQRPSAASSAAVGAARVFEAGSEEVYLHPLHVGAQVIAGTVLGHLGGGVQPHMIFQIRPAGSGAPLIDPKPILDGWVKLESSSAVKATGRDPFAKSAPTAGQALLESKMQLQREVRGDHGIHLPACERRLVGAGRADRRVLATLEFLSASKLSPTVSARSCTAASTSTARRALGAAPVGVGLDISAIDGQPVMGSSGPPLVATTAVRKLAGLQGLMKPLQIASATRIAGAPHSVAMAAYAGVIHVAFTPLGPSARAAGLRNGGLTPAQWLKLVARLGEVPDPTVASKPSPAAIPDGPGTASAAKEGR